ncbi:MAG: hypothetical protein R3B47_10590 [Bacteroidia bacterium]
MPSKNHAIIQGRITHLFYRDYEDKFVIMPEVSLATEETNGSGYCAVSYLCIIHSGLDEIKMEEQPLGVIEILSNPIAFRAY